MLFSTDYYHLPPREIDQAIEWLESVKQDCDLKIWRLRDLKNQHERQARHKRNMNALAQMFDEPDFYEHTTLHQLEIIRQRLGCDYTRAHHVREILIKKKKRRDRKNLHADIIELYKRKKTVAHIARQKGVSRQTVYSVIKKAKEERLML